MLRAVEGESPMATQFDLDKHIDAINARDVDRITQLYAKDAQFVTPDVVEGVHGKEGVREVMQQWVRMFTDLRVQVIERVQQEDRVAALLRVQGTNTGDIELPGGDTIPATGKSVDYQIGTFMTLDNDQKIKRSVSVFDNDLIMTQLGISRLIEQQGQGQTPRR